MNYILEDPNFQKEPLSVVNTSQNTSIVKTPIDYAHDELRSERNRLLAETDWIVTKSAEEGTEVPLVWRQYRQQLRDLPNSCIVQLNKYDHLDWKVISLPTKPE